MVSFSCQCLKNSSCLLLNIFLLLLIRELVIVGLFLGYAGSRIKLDNYVLLHSFYSNADDALHLIYSCNQHAVNYFLCSSQKVDKWSKTYRLNTFLTCSIDPLRLIVGYSTIGILLKSIFRAWFCE